MQQNYGNVSCLMWHDQVVSFLMGAHPRCGSQSPVREFASNAPLLEYFRTQWLQSPGANKSLWLDRFSMVYTDLTEVQLSGATLGVMGVHPRPLKGGPAPPPPPRGRRSGPWDAAVVDPAGERGGVALRLRRETDPIPVEVRLFDERVWPCDARIEWVGSGRLGAVGLVDETGECICLVVDVEETFLRCRLVVLDSLETTCLGFYVVGRPTVLMRCSWPDRTVVVATAKPNQSVVVEKDGMPLLFEDLESVNFFDSRSFFGIIRKESRDLLEVWSCKDFSQAHLILEIPTEGGRVFTAGDFVVIEYWQQDNNTNKVVNALTGTILMETQLAPRHKILRSVECCDMLAHANRLNRSYIAWCW
ncbi:hypothetical protein Pelo_6698 [Pelomyxa schiedti]|nr:hypothetical protein Pelo_6698 [Pelomyxa schiedti]